MPSSLSSPSSSSTSIPIDMDLFDNEDNLTSVSSPTLSLSESEKRFCYSERQPVLQPRIDSTFKQIKSFEERGTKAGEITNAILFMIAKDNMSFQTVDNEGFRNLMKITVPLYSGRKSITKKWKKNMST
ncbi:uncharacterized protein LOC113005270 [Solenopsis invicta]|uniref:uncharacterized protein LOC113005270 n=1 Tax=Solenopsis invicta TaxID=13686 RepID=UPI00193E2E41|nr:uncharacterized protein LOC113005270 [Solenopsis invicta]